MSVGGQNSIQRLFNPAKIDFFGRGKCSVLFLKVLKVMDLELKVQFTKIVKKKTQHVLMSYVLMWFPAMQMLLVLVE